MASFGVEEITLPRRHAHVQRMWPSLSQRWIFSTPAKRGPQLLQIYFMGDNHQQARQRCNNIEDIRENFVLDIQIMLQEKKNEYGQSFKMAIEQMTSEELTLVICVDGILTGQNE